LDVRCLTAFCAAASILPALGLAFQPTLEGLPILSTGAPSSPAPRCSPTLAATIASLGMGGAKRLLASFEETPSLTRATSPLTGSRVAASWFWAQGSCELPTAKPRMRSPIAPLRGATSNQSDPRGRTPIQSTTAQPSFQAFGGAYQLAEIDRFQSGAGLVEEVVSSQAVTDSRWPGQRIGLRGHASNNPSTSPIIDTILSCASLT
jgi:hypothetical protein